SVTSSVSTTIGGSIGFNEAQGFNASVSDSTTVSNSKTTTYPPVDVFNQVKLATGVALFSYKVRHPSHALGSALTFFKQCIWKSPVGAYAQGPPRINFLTVSALTASPKAPLKPAVRVAFGAFVPTPFGDTFQLGSPTVTGVSTPTVKPGDTFTIEGSAFYPSLVQDVLIGGQSVGTANFTPVSDTKIQVVAPNTQGIALPVVVKTTQGLSNDNVTINIGTPQLHVQAQPIAAVAGQALTNVTVATFTDSDTNAKPADFTATINWGDGNTTAGTRTAAGQGTFDVTGSHTYIAAGTYTLAVQIT